MINETFKNKILKFRVSRVELNRNVENQNIQLNEDTRVHDEPRCISVQSRTTQGDAELHSHDCTAGNRFVSYGENYSHLSV